MARTRQRLVVIESPDPPLHYARDWTSHFLTHRFMTVYDEWSVNDDNVLRDRFPADEDEAIVIASRKVAAFLGRRQGEPRPMLIRVAWQGVAHPEIGRREVWDRVASVQLAREFLGTSRPQLVVVRPGSDWPRALLELSSVPVDTPEVARRRLSLRTGAYVVSPDPIEWWVRLARAEQALAHLVVSAREEVEAPPEGVASLVTVHRRR